MSAQSKSKIPGSIFGKVGFYNKIFSYICSQMTVQSVPGQFWPSRPDLETGTPVSSLDLRLLPSVVPPEAQSASSQIISTWLMGYGYQWINSFNSQPGVSSPHHPFVTSADANTFPSKPSTGFFLADMSGNFDLSLNRELRSPFAGSGRVMSFQEALFYYTPKGLRSTQRTKAFHEADAVLEKYTRQTLIPLFLSNATAVSDKDLAAMGLRTRRRVSRGPIPPPQIAPVVDVLNGQNHNIKVTVTELNEGGAARLMVSTPGIRGCRIDWRFADEKQDESDWESIHCTRFNEWIKFGEKDAGRIVEIQAAFLNPRLQPGPVSNIVRAVIT